MHCNQQWQYALSLTFHYFADDRLCAFSISSEVIFQLFKSLNSKKALEQDNFFKKMLKLYVPYVCKLLTDNLWQLTTFDNCLRSIFFPEVYMLSWCLEKWAILLIKDYWPVPLLRICEKLLEKLMLKSC